MKVTNLVFNRIGNSFSVILEYPEFNIQIIEEARFTVDNIPVELCGISVDIDCPFKIFLKIENSKTDILFNTDKVHIKKMWSFTPSKGGFFSNNNELLFLSGTDSNLSTYLKDEELFIPEENFLKSIAQFIIKKRQIGLGKWE